MADVAWDPETYLRMVLEDVPGYEELEEAVAGATGTVPAARILELGTGTGETALRVLERHPGASWVGVDASEAMLARARERLPGADLRLGRLEDPLPAGRFDLVVSVLTVHHLDGPHKRDLFSRVARALRPGGSFVLGDVVVPADGEPGPIEIEWEIDLPDSVDDQLAWLGEAGFVAEATSVRVDLALFEARLPEG